MRSIINNKLSTQKLSQNDSSSKYITIGNSNLDPYASRVSILNNMSPFQTNKQNASMNSTIDLHSDNKRKEIKLKFQTGSDISK